MKTKPSSSAWTFLTNHARVLVCVANDPGMRLRDVAERVNITERAARRIVFELAADGYIAKKRVGRRNHYTVDFDSAFRHTLEQGHQIGQLLSLFKKT